MRYAAANALSQCISTPPTVAVRLKSTCSQCPGEKAPPHLVDASPSIANAGSMVGCAPDELLARHCVRGGRASSSACATTPASTPRATAGNTVTGPKNDSNRARLAIRVQGLPTSAPAADRPHSPAEYRPLSDPRTRETMSSPGLRCPAAIESRAASTATEPGTGDGHGTGAVRGSL